MNECGLSIMKSEHGDARHIPRWRRRRQWGGLALSAPPSPSQLAKGASGAAFDSRICRERDGHAKDTYEVFVSEEDLFRFDASTVGMDGQRQQQKRERKIDELFGYRRLELAAPETRTAQDDGRRGRRPWPPRPHPSPQRAVAQTCQTAAILSPSSSSSSSSSSFGCAGERQTRSSERRRGATVLRIYFDLTATAE